jgi:ribosome recycling factor
MPENDQLLSDKIKDEKNGMDKAIDHLQNELVKVRAGKASPIMLDGISVDYYGTMTPLSQVSNVSASDSKTLTIQPWEKSMLAPIEKAIFEANLGLTPMNDGEIVRISIPATTEERRKELVKKTKGLGEDAKVSIRDHRHKALDAIKKEVKSGYPEDAGKRLEKEVDDMTKSYNDKVDDMLKQKEKDIMTI